MELLFCWQPPVAEVPEALKIALELEPDLTVSNQAGQGVMHIAVNNGQAADSEKIIQFLADKGVRLDGKDARGATPWDTLERRGPDNLKVLYTRLLTEHGIQPTKAQ